ncbi:MAG: hypothetical protein HND58_09195 [Planctomycetota bacterium]|nr:MAG: hypothetical protein HND58_09195 [Planctomycetota bacterium]
MQRALETSDFNRASATRVALALFLCGPDRRSGARPGGGAPPPPRACSRSGGTPARAQSQLRRVAAGVLVWLGWGQNDQWSGVVEALGGDQAATWGVGLADMLGPTLRPLEAGGGAAAVFPFDLSFDCNLFRDRSPHPFSRTTRGRVLDALQIDNARTARLSIVPSQDEEHPGRLSLVLFSQSRGEVPGTWHALPLATIDDAPTRDAAAAPGHPVELDLGEEPRRGGDGPRGSGARDRPGDRVHLGAGAV